MPNPAKDGQHTMPPDEIEIRTEEAPKEIYDAFPRQTVDETTAPVAPETVENTPETTDSTVETPVVEATPVVDPVTPPAQPVIPTAEEVKPETDYKKKFSESTRRNQIVESQFKELQKTLGDITKQEVPTDEEMASRISDWEYLSDREKNLEIRSIVIENRLNQVVSTIGNIATESENDTKLNDFINNDPRLKGKESEFYEFATRPANKGASMDIVLGAFLFETTPIVEPLVVAPVEVAPSLERGNSSGDLPPVRTGDQEMTDDEIKLIRTTDHKRYMELVRTGKI